jgi:hypothetical protein
MLDVVGLPFILVVLGAVLINAGAVLSYGSFLPRSIEHPFVLMLALSGAALILLATLMASAP